MAIIEGMACTRRIEALEEQVRMLLQAVEYNRRHLADVSSEQKHFVSREALTEALQAVMVGWEARLEVSQRAQDEKFLGKFSCQDETEEMKAALEKRVCWEDFTLGLQKLKENCRLAHEQTTADSAMNLHKAHLQRQLDKKVETCHRAHCIELEEVQNHNINILRNDLSEQIFNNLEHFQHSMAQIKSMCQIMWNKFGLHLYNTSDNAITDNCFSTSHTPELVTPSPALALNDCPSSPASNIVAICDIPQFPPLGKLSSAIYAKCELEIPLGPHPISRPVPSSKPATAPTSTTNKSLFHVSDTNSSAAAITTHSDTTLTTKLDKSALHISDTSGSVATTTTHTDTTLTSMFDKSPLHVSDTSSSAATTTPHPDTTLTSMFDKNPLHVSDTSSSAATTTPHADTTLTSKYDKNPLHISDTSSSAATTTPHSDTTLTTKLDKSPLHISDTNGSAATTITHSDTTLTTKFDKSPLHVSDTSSSAAATTPHSNTTLTTNVVSIKCEDQSCPSHQAVDWSYHIIRPCAKVSEQDAFNNSYSSASSYGKSLRNTNKAEDSKSHLSESQPYHKYHRLESDAILPRSAIEI